MPRIRSRVLVLFLRYYFCWCPGPRGASHPVSSSGTLLTYYFCWFRDLAVPCIRVSRTGTLLTYYFCWFRDCAVPGIRSRVLVLLKGTISAGSGTARCLASGLEFWYLILRSWLVLSSKSPTRRPSDSGV